MKNNEIIIHLAALINVDHSIQTPLPFYKTNVQGTMNLLEAIRHEPSVKKLVYMSTFEVYGNVLNGKASEETPCDPRSPYASSKYAAERYCLSYYTTYKKPEITIIRGANTYGPRQTYGVRGAAIAIFITKILDGNPPVIFGDGNQSRDYVYVKDMAKGIADASLKMGIGGEIINLCSGKTITVKEIALKILEETGSTLKPIYEKARAGEIKGSCGDPSKALKLLGWKAETPFDEGLRETIEYYHKP